MHFHLIGNNLQVSVWKYYIPFALDYIIWIVLFA